jgi:hypothetical protein
MRTGHAHGLWALAMGRVLESRLWHLATKLMFGKIAARRFCPMN